MTELVVAALGAAPGRVLLIEPSLPDVAAVASRGAEPFVLHRSQKRALGRPALDAAAAHGPLAALCAEPESSPFEAGSFDALVAFDGLPLGISVVEYRRQVRVGGLVVIASRVRDGMAGGAASLVRRAARSEKLPLAADMTAALLTAGLRPVRQAAGRRAMTPFVVTWGEVRSRPWEE